MKNLNYLLLMLVSLLFSCSNDDDGSGTNEEVSLSGFVQKNYNVSSSPNVIIDSIYYELQNNKILSAVRTNVSTSVSNNTAYDYIGNKIVSTSSFANGVMALKNNYVYDSNDKLIEFRQESYNTSNQITAIQKHTFTHTQDTIFSQWNRSTNNGVSYTNIANFKIVLDQNQNRTYFEEQDMINNAEERVLTTYDANSNILNEQYFNVGTNGELTLTLTNSATYSNFTNPLAVAMNATFGRKTLMLLYHLQTGAINNINARNLSPKTMSTFTTSFGGGEIGFEITNTPFDINFTQMSDYKTLNAGALFSRFSLEYFFE
ncbi:hypothetical protein [Flavobacterium sp.]|uniref:hypothetical protein n=1 Tax=Flavobacterium sp. TaxID=239 RepID=UPI00391CB830